jgi:hypothetical protein
MQWRNWLLCILRYRRNYFLLFFHRDVRVQWVPKQDFCYLFTMAPKKKQADIGAKGPGFAKLSTHVSWWDIMLWFYHQGMQKKDQPKTNDKSNKRQWMGGTGAKYLSGDDVSWQPHGAQEIQKLPNQGIKVDDDTTINQFK